MENKNKDKIIIGLIIALAIAIGNNFIKEKQGDSLNENFTLLDKNEDDLLLEDETDDDAKENEAMKVHITGQINREGVYEIKDGDRLEDLINKAGGLSPDADSKSLNLAMKLEDQMKIYIPSKDEILDQEDASTDQIISNADPSSQEGKININEASKEELMTLPNIGEKRAQAIIDYRQSKKFETIEEIKNVTGIGDKFYQAMQDLITV
ncbi:MAG: helix-hairpin-helix domain-containing protein [Anaerococcus sp.]|uniref:helix-hairpin-helix domain-containing protein n=1 Tax=Anaerococcus sp. TaxID=1872515 RepID=UPI002902EC45|nr:helix-hairpin-helix domain-containing protein [Anaerococcus sp.]MDU0894630.1 helix-hairpin-helix domain-containing protein [Anaerococcus sp.]MDU7411519.1 helix-hairpin-helix domain-containing protein [Anaerococcus sp.]